MNQPDKPKRRWPAFLAGAITSLLVIVIIIGLKFVAGSLANFGGPRVLTDAAVRARIEERGVTLPASAGNLYHSIVAFVDHTEFIGFTTAPEDAMPIAIAFARLHHQLSRLRARHKVRTQLREQRTRRLGTRVGKRTLGHLQRHERPGV